MTPDMWHFTWWGVNILSKFGIDSVLNILNSKDDSINELMHLILDTRISVRCVWCSRYTPWILKWNRMESVGQILISLYSKTKPIIFFFFFFSKKFKKIIFLKMDFPWLSDLVFNRFFVLLYFVIFCLDSLKSYFL